MKTIFFIIFILGFAGAANAFAFREATVTLDGTVYDLCFVTPDNGIYCMYVISPGESVCGSDLVIEYSDGTSESMQHSICIQGGECLPGNGECQDGMMPVKMCSEYTFSCTVIYPDNMAEYSLANDTFSCARGYYKNKMDCSPCPDADGTGGTTVGNGAVNVSQCYLPTDAIVRDASGTYTHIENCFYVP